MDSYITSTPFCNVKSFQMIYITLAATRSKKRLVYIYAIEHCPMTLPLNRGISFIYGLNSTLFFQSIMKKEDPCVNFVAPEGKFTCGLSIFHNTMRKQETAKGDMTGLQHLLKRLKLKICM